MPHVDRLALALRVAARSPCPQRGAGPRAARRALAVPRAGARATGCAASRASGRSTTRSPRPAIAVAAARRGAGGDGGGQPDPQPRREPRQRRPRPRRCCRPAARWSSTGAKTDGVDSLARQVARGAAARRRLRQGARPGVLADPARRAARRRSPPGRATPRPRRNADGFLTAPGMFSPERRRPRQPPARRGARRPARRPGRRPRRRLGLAGAGGAGARARRSPSSTSTRPRRWRSTPRASTSPTRAPRFHWTDVTRARRAASPPYDAVIANPPFHQGRAAEPDLGAAFIAAAARILKPVGPAPDGRQPPAPLRGRRSTPPSATGRSSSEDGAYKVIAAERPRRP